MHHCHNCGNQLNDGDRFCKHCGAKRQKYTAALMPDLPVAPAPKKIQPVHIVIGILGLLLFLLLVVFLIAYHTQAEPEPTPEKPSDTPVEVVVLTWQEQYDLGMKYLSDGNYEEAIIAFETAIELEPMNAQLYMDLADAYVTLDDWEMAFSVLEDGYALTEDEALSLYLEQLQEAYMMKNAPNLTDLVTELETVLAFQMFAENTENVLYYQGDWDGDGQQDLFSYYGDSQHNLIALFYNHVGDTVYSHLETWSSGNYGGTVQWSASMNCPIVSGWRSSMGGGRRDCYKFDNNWSQIVEYYYSTDWENDYAK